jgi:hypothetical protein
MTTTTPVRQPSASTGTAILFITVGVLMAIWSAVWYFFLARAELAPPQWKWYVCAGLFFSGLAIMVIGILVGRIGQEAKQADSTVGAVTPPQVVAQAPPVVQVPASQVQAVPMQSAQAQRVVSQP